ncbi:hypothetical protein [Pseudonocardia spinosispora]|uniref:hypothetical protein n=1 Tax=Pseudonocardia spinosispora TaxID=103441 RepID=UPI000684F650|nr:hypothetical protein [Pseudonocardia spinosispora]
MEYQAVRGSVARPVDEPVSLRRIAFGDRPSSAPIVCRGDAPERRWLAAVALGAQGHYGAAASLLDGLYRDRGTPRALRAHAAVTRAAHLRQLGGHLMARGWDAKGLVLATPLASAERSGGAEAETDPDGLGLAAARLDALVGLAADSVGLTDLEQADRLLFRAERCVVEHTSWRPAVRLFWVRAELALSRGQMSDAVRHGREAVARAGVTGSVRHMIKSELILVVAESTAGLGQDEAVNRLNLLLEQTRHAGLTTLEWVVNLLLASTLEVSDATGARVYQRSVATILARIRNRTDSVGRRVFDRSPWVPNLADL